MRLKDIKLTEVERLRRDAKIAAEREKAEKRDAFVQNLSERLARGEITDNEFWTLQFEYEIGERR